MFFKIYPSIITTHDNWEGQMAEVKALGLTEICLFPTCLNPIERQKLYKLLEETKVTYIPLVHLRHDSTADEISYFMKCYGKPHFNIHTQLETPFRLLNDLSKFNKYIYVETGCVEFVEEELEKYAGICLDTAHVESFRLIKNKLYGAHLATLEKFPIGIVHLSAISAKELKLDYEPPYKERHHYDVHHFENLRELNYVKRYQKYLPEIIALELANPITEQLKAITYLEKLLR